MTWAELQEQRRIRAEKQRRQEELREIAKGPIDLPFLLLVVQLMIL